MRSFHSGKAWGSVPPGRWAKARAIFTKRCVRRRSPSSASANSVGAHWAGANKVEVVMRGCRRRNRRPATITGHADKMPHQFLEEKPREDVGKDKDYKPAWGVLRRKAGYKPALH